ncbi:hypothetical protein [Alteromonas gracilis]|uniref:hypothetical protein n=1 Tax=Alteromonas gracilis TaxID=1479524 RepID=UPI0030CCA31F
MDLDIRDLYQRLFRVANEFLALSMSLSIKDLQDHDPSVSEIAKAATMLAALMDELADDEYSEKRIAMNAAQAALFMRQIAIAVRKDDQELLDRSIADLENINFV